MMRILIECTYVFEHPEVNSGIQRVVRNVIRNLDTVQAEVECIPVVFLRGRMFRVLALAPLSGRDLPWHSRMRVALEQLRNDYWMWHARLERRGEDYFVIDLGSTNHTRVNGEPVRERVLAHGDEVRFARARCRFVVAAVDPVAGEV